ncbi:hypothetical protein AB0C59_10945 [Streptomyces sp. NPDC048664]|uniref:hypothetical protein n=1 Tax=Streptomyces sp. NPDC048664 TaxID=3154505 RepID=UPI00341C3AB6
MKAPTLFKALTGVRAGRGWRPVVAATALALLLGQSAAVAAGHEALPPRCPVVPRPPHGAVRVPATTGPARLPGATRLVDTGVCVRRAVGVTATGLIGAGTRTDVGPDGDAGRAGPRFALPGARRWSLLGRVGHGPWRFVGAGPTVLTGDGELYLAVNDDFYRDNSGSFTARVSRCTCGSRCALFETDLADDSLAGLESTCFDRGVPARRHRPGQPRP